MWQLAPQSYDVCVSLVAEYIPEVDLLSDAQLSTTQEKFWTMQKPDRIWQMTVDY